MANTKISALTSASTPLAGTEVLPIVQSSTTKQVSVANLTAGRAVSALSFASTTGANFATSSGNVGIGTASPTNKLDLGFTDTAMGWYLSGSYFATIKYTTAARTLTITTNSGDATDAIILATANTERMRINNTGNSIFAGTISPQQATTASAPAYVKGAMYFDTTLNKLRIGGATAWETVTSV